MQAVRSKEITRRRSLLSVVLLVMQGKKSTLVFSSVVADSIEVYYYSYYKSLRLHLYLVYESKNYNYSVWAVVPVQFRN